MPPWTGPVGHTLRHRYQTGKPMHALEVGDSGGLVTVCRKAAADKQYLGSIQAITCPQCRGQIKKEQEPAR